MRSGSGSGLGLGFTTSWYIPWDLRPRSTPLPPTTPLTSSALFDPLSFLLTPKPSSTPINSPALSTLSSFPPSPANSQAHGCCHDALPRHSATFDQKAYVFNYVTTTHSTSRNVSQHTHSNHNLPPHHQRHHHPIRARLITRSAQPLPQGPQLI